jgi:hypothetical protein
MDKKKDNTFVKIFEENWEDFKGKYPGYDKDHYNKEVEKLINCGDESFGYIEFGCMFCGEHSHRVAFTCKGALCLSCSRVKSENFVGQVMSKLHPGVIYRHLILTIPDQLKSFFYKNRHEKDLYNKFYQIGFEYIQDVFEKVLGKRLKCGAIIVLHTTGRKGNYRPHLHIIVMNGGIDIISGRWMNLKYFPYEKILPRKWQWHLLNMIKGFEPSEEIKKLVSDLWKKYPKGFYNHFKKGDVPSKSKKLVGYLSKYLFRPTISLKRIIKYDLKKGLVKYEYVDHKTHKSEIEEVEIMVFIGRMAQQLLPKSFHRVKYYGLQYPRTFEKSRALIMEGLEKANLSKEDKSQAVFKAPKLSYQERLKLWTGKDPLKCPGCDSEMVVIKIWTKAKGYIFDLLEVIKRTGKPPDELVWLQCVRPTDPKDIADQIFDQMSMDI